MPQPKSDAQVLLEGTADVSGLREYMPPVPVCGILVRIYEDNGMSEFGCFFAAQALIKVRTRGDRPFSDDFIRDTIVHEFVHAFMTYSGAAHRWKSRTKMTSEQWEEFEEDEVATSLTPLIAATFLSGSLVFPSLPPARRHRRR